MTTIERALYEWNSDKYEKHHILASLSKEELPVFLEQVISHTERSSKTITVPILGEITILHSGGYWFFTKSLQEDEHGYKVAQLRIAFADDMHGEDYVSPLAQYIADVYDLFHGR